MNDLRQKFPHKAQQLDELMRNSVSQAIHALSSNEVTGITELAMAIGQAQQCFQQWGLSEGKVGQHIKELHQQGALAAKPTGSGSGGYILSLWKKPPGSELTNNWIEL